MGECASCSQVKMWLGDLPRADPLLRTSLVSGGIAIFIVRWRFAEIDRDLDAGLSRSLDYLVPKCGGALTFGSVNEQGLVSPARIAVIHRKRLVSVFPHDSGVAGKSYVKNRESCCKLSGQGHDNRGIYVDARVMRLIVGPLALFL